ncbi:MAG: WD40/YVTN/BNR-like repeat-containing protein [Candidatus Saccharicenans sp.]
MKKRLTAFSFFLVLILILGLTISQAQTKISVEIFKGMPARSIGPANMSGRIGAIEAVASDPRVIYVGGAAGGVWKSTDGGLTWKPIFDSQPVSSIGAITVFQKNPDIIWVGTGEAAPRNSVSVGRGVFRSLDGGNTWQCLGLEKTERISDIIIHPDNPDIVLVGALGAAWSDSQERGVFKTTDGGKTWKKVLYVNEKTGVADMAMDPADPNHIIVAMWEYRRLPWFFTSGGPGSGIYVTRDGGETWRKLTEKNGLPAGELGRCGIAFAPGRPQIVYALIEAKKNGFYRSNDGGETWTLINGEADIHNRPFYYSRVFVNPVNENIVYLCQTQLRVSEDGGRTFRPLTGFNQAHSDFHALWVSPDGETLVVGNDGGVVITHDRGETWYFVKNLPFAQYYHINYDLQIPYNLYGGLQDNGTWIGPAYVLPERAIQFYYWRTIGGGDGFDAAPDLEKPGCGYGMSQGGNLFYFDLNLGTTRAAVPTESEVKHRFNWNAGFAVDPFNPSTIYLGSQFVHRSRDKGRTWEIISPDLTTNDPEKQKQKESGGLTLDVSNAENYCTILSIAPSPVKEGIIWVGTDDGNLQLTRDGGKSWELVSKSLTTGKKPLIPAGASIPHIKPSHFDEATAYVVFDDHMRGNFSPYLVVTHDFGKTWKSLVTPEIDGYCRAIEEDPVKRDLLFLGTEFGLFVSLNGGQSWFKWTSGFPTCPVYDLAVHPRENDLIVATHGRALFIIDDISPLRELTEEVLKKKLYLFKVNDAWQLITGRTSAYMSPGDGEFSGQNKPYGAYFTYYLTPSEKKGEEAAAPEMGQMQERMLQFAQRSGMSLEMIRQMMPGRGRVQITVVDSKGKLIRQLNGPEEKGINRIFWDFRQVEPAQPTDEPVGAESRQQAMAMGFFGGRGGITVPPGTYTVKIKYEDQEVSQNFEVKPDPRLKIDLEIVKTNYEKAQEAQKLSRAIQIVSNRLQQTQRGIQTIRELARAQRNPKLMEVMKQVSEVEKKLKELTETLNPTPAKQGMADRSDGLMSQVMMAVGGITSAGYEPITQAAQVKYDQVKVKLGEFFNRVNEFYEKDVAGLNKALQEAGFTILPGYPAVKID